MRELEDWGEDGQEEVSGWAKEELQAMNMKKQSAGHIRESEKPCILKSSEKGKNKKAFNLADGEAKSVQLF